MPNRPIRIQLRRTKGWRMPENTVRVARPTKWGNPFPIKELVWVAVAMGFRADVAGRTACAVELHRRWLGMPAEDGPLAALPCAAGDLEFADGSTCSVDQHARGIAAGIAAAMGVDITLPPRPTMDEIVTELRGKNLACWCPLDGPCHADVLLELANRDPASPEPQP